jgi:uncharacterized protein
VTGAFNPLVLNGPENQADYSPEIHHKQRGTIEGRVMTDRKNLPAKSPTRELATSAEQPGGLVARGLISVRDMQAQQRSLSTEAKAEKLFRLGMRYTYGEDGVQEDFDKARQYFLQASELDHAEAQYELAILLCNEYGTDEEAYGWLKRSADLRCGPALMKLIEMNSDMPQEQKDDIIGQAREWYLAHANTGDPRYQLICADFLGDSEDSFRWLKASAEQDYVDACKALGRHYLAGEISEYTTQQGIYWLSRAVALGNHYVCRELGDLYLRGNLGKDNKDHSRRLRVEPDSNMAIAWYERGIAMGNTYIAFQLGKYYLEGQYLDPDLQLAEKWLLHAANRGIASAREILGREYASGTRLRQDADAAVHWLGLATELSGAAGLMLADMYLEGQLVPKSIAEAIKWLDRAMHGRHRRNDAMKLLAKKGFDGRFSSAEEAIGQSWLARMVALTLASVADRNKPIDRFDALDVAKLYDLGLGVQRDQEKAIYWYKKSADLDSSRRRLKELGIDWKPPDAP